MSDKNYIHPAQKRQEEHEKRKEKKKKKRGLLWLLILLLLIALLIGGIGWGQGWFKGKGENEGSDTTSGSAESTSYVSESSSVTEDSSLAEAEKVSVAVTVSGSKYILNGTEKTLDELKTEFSSLDKAASVIAIADEGAVANAVSSLHDMLNELGLPYSDLIPAAADSSSEAAE